MMMMMKTVFHNTTPNLQDKDRYQDHSMQDQDLDQDRDHSVHDQDRFLVSDRSCPKTDGLRPQHWKPYVTYRVVHVWWPWMASKRFARFVSDNWVSCFFLSLCFVTNMNWNCSRSDSDGYRHRLCKLWSLLDSEEAIGQSTARTDG